MPKLNRTVSQTGKEALWTKDKQVLLSSLADFGYFTFADLDYFTIDKSVIASFKYFETEDIIHTNTITTDFVEDAYEVDPIEVVPASNDRVRIYYDYYEDDTINSSKWVINLYDPAGYQGGTGFGWADALTKIDYTIYATTYYNREVKVDAFDDPIIPYEDVDESGDTNIYVKRYFLVISKDSDLREPTVETGLSWALLNTAYPYGIGDGLEWQIIYPAWTDVDVVINDARFMKVDKQFHWDT